VTEAVPVGRSPDQPVVEVRDVTVRYRGGVTALADVSLSWPRGVTALLGANGAGKTTLLNVVTGALAPRSGSVRVLLGSDDDPDTRRAGVGYLPQEAGWPGHFTVAEFVSYLAWTRRVSRSGRAAKVAKAISEVGLADQQHVRLSRLSGGQRRRAMLAQALVDDPALLVLDEPTAGFDPLQRVAFRDLVSGLARSRAIVISTHLVEDVELLADWVSVLRQGRVVYSGSKADLLAQDLHGNAATSPLENAFVRLAS
jgi:ABC-2 type transport system ATP-binding protein